MILAKMADKEHDHTGSVGAKFTHTEKEGDSRNGYC